MRDERYSRIPASQADFGILVVLAKEAEEAEEAKEAEEIVLSNMTDATKAQNKSAKDYKRIAIAQIK